MKNIMNANDLRIAAHPGAVRSTPIVWPVDRHKSNQIQQTKITSQPQAQYALTTPQPSTPIVAPRTTPKNVTQVRVITRPPVNGQKTVVGQFTHPANDPHFQGASVYLRKSGGQPTQVAAGNK